MLQVRCSMDEWATSVLSCLWIRTLERKRFLRAIFSRYHVCTFWRLFTIPLPVCLNCWFPCWHIPGSWLGRCILTSEGQAWSQHHQLHMGCCGTLKGVTQSKKSSCSIWEFRGHSEEDKGQNNLMCFTEYRVKLPIHGHKVMSNLSCSPVPVSKNPLSPF